MRDHTFDIWCAIAAERRRQEEEEGFTSEGDDGKDMAELGRMAASYLLLAASQSVPSHLPIRQVLHHRSQLCWPVVDGVIKPHETRRALIIAGALTMAEIEWLDRKTGYHSERYRADYTSRTYREIRAALDEAWPPGRVLP